MKRYEYKIIAALVTILISMCCPKNTSGAPYPPPTGRRGSPSKQRGKVMHHTCTESKSYFFRSQCSDNGFLTVVKNRVLVQTTGLDIHHSAAEFVVETCSSRLGSFPSSSKPSSSSPIVRYRHKKSRKYICFTKRGKVRTVSKRQVDKRGLLCMFRQQPVDEGDDVVEANTFHRLQSVHNRRWHLGFDHKNSSLSMIKGTTHRGALPRRGKFFNPKKCDFKFFAGEYRIKNSDEIWDGVFDLVDRNSMVSKAVDLNNVEVSTNELRTGGDKVVKNSKQKVISSALKEALQQQKVLRRKSLKYRNRIRHARHKKPRLNREKKNLLKRSKKPISKS
eukprot:TRINITY_DN22925_c0_g1_i1.p1 TRINITY_DN22925_c0_g1~~TRINITY_DN22925_c0_g1_i1.p1  ORF type:complete len:334 (-),score=46.73 TRINITY_DN22925_c0_g1_i1:605-1606(-)